MFFHSSIVRDAPEERGVARFPLRGKVTFCTRCGESGERAGQSIVRKIETVVTKLGDKNRLVTNVFGDKLIVMFQIDRSFFAVCHQCHQKKSAMGEVKNDISAVFDYMNQLLS